MRQLMMLLFSVIATTFMGSAIVVVLTMGMSGWRPIVMAAGAGLLLAFPVCWMVARQILKRQVQR